MRQAPRSVRHRSCRLLLARGPVFVVELRGAYRENGNGSLVAEDGRHGSSTVVYSRGCRWNPGLSPWSTRLEQRQGPWRGGKSASFHGGCCVDRPRSQPIARWAHRSTRDVQSGINRPHYWFAPARCGPGDQLAVEPIRFRHCEASSAAASHSPKAPRTGPPPGHRRRSHPPIELEPSGWVARVGLADWYEVSADRNCHLGCSYTRSD